MLIHNLQVLVEMALKYTSFNCTKHANKCLKHSLCIQVYSFSIVIYLLIRYFY